MVSRSRPAQEVQQYGNELDGYRERLRDDIGKDSLDQVVESLIGDTTRVRVKTGIYHEHLKKSSEEVERLRGELELVQGLALTDPLTGLLNRRGFDQQMQRIRHGSLAGLHADDGSTSITSRPSTMRTGTCSATRSSSRWPTCCAAASANAARSPASVARNSRCCCRTPPAPAGRTG
jgi:hypothetical protein